ncbi:MAG: hypothetical protein ACO1RX_21050 [Candidatus Sericytochromatia bacterium]
MTPPGIVELVTAFQNHRISRQHLEQALSHLLERCLAQAKALHDSPITAADRKNWEQEFVPCLEVCYGKLREAILIAQDYAQQRDDSLIAQLVDKLQEVDRKMAFLELQASQVAPATRQLLTEALAIHLDGLAVHTAGRPQAGLNALADD